MRTQKRRTQRDKNWRSKHTGPSYLLNRLPKSPVVLGTGFLALDVVITDGREHSPRTWAGGTCGNVLAILSYLGWRAYPVSSLGMDPGAERIIEDLTEFDVDVRFIRNDTGRRTPIVIERIRQVPGGTPRSRFVWTCPGCGTWLPGYHPVLAKDMVTVVANMPDPSVFFFDRVSRGALDLAEAAAKSGALIVFEPSGVGEERLFRKALALSHILKYSHERLTGVGERLGNGAPLLEIETLGAEGLRYRFRGRSASKGWRLMGAYPVREVKDTVGAGDWCTAGVIHALGVKGVVGLMNADEGELEGGLRLGQALAALTCAFEGARGGMYAMDKKQFLAATKRVLDGGSPSCQVEWPEVGPLKIWKAICPACGPKTTQANKSKS